MNYGRIGGPSPTPCHQSLHFQSQHNYLLSPKYIFICEALCSLGCGKNLPESFTPFEPASSEVVREEDADSVKKFRDNLM